MPLRAVLLFFAVAALLVASAALLACSTVSAIVAWEGCETLIDATVATLQGLAGLVGRLI